MNTKSTKLWKIQVPDTTQLATCAIKIDTRFHQEWDRQVCEIAGGFKIVIPACVSDDINKMCNAKKKS